MCSVGDDFDGAQLLPESNKIDKDDLQLNKCNKCKIQEPCIVLRGKDKYCKSCFLQAADHKFKALLGKHKIIAKDETVLVLHKGGHASTALLHLIRTGLDRSAHKKLRFTPIILFVDDELSLDVTERLNILNKIKEESEKFGFSPHFATIKQAVTLNLKTVVEPETLELSNDDCKQLEKFLVKQKNLTNKKEYLSIVTRNFVIEIAESLGCKHIFSPELSLDMAAQLLTDISLGRGSEVALSTGFCDSRKKVNILRPLRFFDLKELTYYNYYNNLEPVIWSKPPEKQYDSVQNLIKKFVDDLQVNYPATVTTILRTGDKLEVGDGICTYCNAPMTSDAKSFCSAEATKFSKLLSNEAMNSDESYRKMYGRVMERFQHECDESIQRLCFACSQLNLE